MDARGTRGHLRETASTTMGEMVMLHSIERSVTWRRAAGFGALSALAVVVTAAPARAQQSPARNDPPQLTLTPDAAATQRDISGELRQTPAGKAGPIMANLKAGPSIGLGGLPVTAAIQLDVGYAFIKGNGRGIGHGDLYGVVSPELGVGSGVTLSLPVGVQYDMPIGIRGLYVYPRTTVGYTAIVDPSDDGESGDAFSIKPAAGVKFVPDPRIAIGFEPVSVPVHVGNGDTTVQYQMLGYAGGNF